MGELVTQGAVLARSDGLVVDGKLRQPHRRDERIGLQGLRIEKDKAFAGAETDVSIRQQDSAVRREFLSRGDADREVVDIFFDRIVA